MYVHLVCSAEFFAVASGRQSMRKLFRQATELMVLVDHEFVANISPLCLSFGPLLRGHIPSFWGSGL